MKTDLPKTNKSKGIPMDTSKKYTGRKNWNSQQGGKVIRRAGRG